MREAGPAAPQASPTRVMKPPGNKHVQPDTNYFTGKSRPITAMSQASPAPISNVTQVLRVRILSHLQLARVIVDSLAMIAQVLN